MTVHMAAVSSSRPLLSIAEAEPPAGWRWPIAIDRYDRSVDLTPAERAAFDLLDKEAAGWWFPACSCRCAARRRMVSSRTLARAVAGRAGCARFAEPAARDSRQPGGWDSVPPMRPRRAQLLGMVLEHLDTRARHDQSCLHWRLLLFPQRQRQALRHRLCVPAAVPRRSRWAWSLPTLCPGQQGLRLRAYGRDAGGVRTRCWSAGATLPPVKVRRSHAFSAV